MSTDQTLVDVALGTLQEWLPGYAVLDGPVKIVYVDHPSGAEVPGEFIVEVREYVDHSGSVRGTWKITVQVERVDR